MPRKSRIEWTDVTWNPLRGCTRVSKGCENCYAERLAARFAQNGQAHYTGIAEQTAGGPRWTGRMEVVSHLVDAPLRWKKPRIVFVNSMSDIFHERVPANIIAALFSVMRAAHWHQFQVLTKRSERLAKITDATWWAPNIWMGVSVEDAQTTHRIPHLRLTDAAVKFLSIEPLIGPIPDMFLEDIDWVIVGGESGPAARPLDAEWVRDIRMQCARARVPFFFKQWGGLTAKSNGCLLDGAVIHEMPEPLPPRPASLTPAEQAAITALQRLAKTQPNLATADFSSKLAEATDGHTLSLF